MNVGELILHTLKNLREDTDEETVQLLRQDILDYLNMGYGEVMVHRLERSDYASLAEDQDVPDFDGSLHYILADFAAYRMLLSGSKTRQARGEAFYSSYLNGLSKVLPPIRKATVHKFGGYL